ncbi:hypothetical protein [Deinococcus roseus]|uniref:Cell wall-active antibiotics response LiaF-like C-terminal domain-containing protein n=1 Tax=Deinococcus roseus TaxID=392414 RepID=A0ABQ2D2W8_9DEIO|nr:hypothetical protein [Deinococcus roseus]GGJ43631.1 hypothetical protein GCM10008938_32420 [Deinococcus roseus]
MKTLMMTVLLTAPVAAAPQIQKVDLHLKHEAGTFTVQAAPKASPTLGIKNPTVKNGVAYLSQSSVASDWKVGLSPKLPLDLHLSSSASDVNANLLGLNINTLEINHTAGDYQLKLPSKTLTGKLKMDSLDLKITVPKDTGLKLNLQKFISGSVTIERNRVAEGAEVTGSYQTGNFDTASKKIELDVTWQAGALTVVR